jgi:hypothetical protein
MGLLEASIELWGSMQLLSISWIRALISSLQCSKSLTTVGFQLVSRDGCYRFLQSWEPLSFVFIHLFPLHYLSYNSNKPARQQPSIRSLGIRT